ncbi:MAG TPA: chorismate mutase [Actinomycetota bacterium]|jgi:chorismate mutase
MRALRGATTASGNEPDAIVDATAELLTELFDVNAVAPDDLVSILFTSTPDLDAEFPAAAARRLGLGHVPLLCATEIAVPGAPAKCIRVLAHLYTERDYASLRHVYRGDARSLPTDLPR